MLAAGTSELRTVRKFRLHSRAELVRMKLNETKKVGSTLEYESAPRTKLKWENELKSLLVILLLWPWSNRACVYLSLIVPPQSTITPASLIPEHRIERHSSGVKSGRSLVWGHPGGNGCKSAQNTRFFHKSWLGQFCIIFFSSKFCVIVKYQSFICCMGPAFSPSLQNAIKPITNKIWKLDIWALPRTQLFNKS